MLTSVELCAGAGGQALGLEQAGFDHNVLIDNDPDACRTLSVNRPQWNVICGSLTEFSALPYKGIDLVAGGVPCPPFSKAGKQLGANDERNLFDEALRVVDESRPQAVMLENVRGLLDPKFAEYRLYISETLKKLGYKSGWKLVQASDFGVSQLRPRVVLVGIKNSLAHNFRWPNRHNIPPKSVGDVIFDLMAERGWSGVEEWRLKANRIAPTIVGGSKKHGGPDLGPTRAKRAWAELGVFGGLVANEAPGSIYTGRPGFENMPSLTVRMVARLQGFPDDWFITGKKTTAYRQVGNAFPPPVAKALGLELYSCITKRTNHYVNNFNTNEQLQLF